MCLVLSQQRGELGQRSSVGPGALKEGLLQLSWPWRFKGGSPAAVGGGGLGPGQALPGHREAKWQESPDSMGSNPTETLTASCAIEGET